VEQSELWDLDFTKGTEQYRDTEKSWAAIQYQPNEITRGKDGMIQTMKDLNEGGGYVFQNLVGEGSEPCNIGLITKDGKNWEGSAFCKTQYAEKFLEAHLSVVKILDICKAEGIKVKVSDEGGYYQKRDVEALAKEVGEWDKMIRGYTGAFQKLVSDTGGKLVSQKIPQRIAGWVEVDKPKEEAEQPRYGYGKKKLPIQVKGKRPYIRQQIVGRKKRMNKPKGI
jgi:hypothetical protein